MKCQDVKTWLLRADSLESSAWPTSVADHVNECKKCARLAWKIRRLEESWRDQEMPEGVEEAKAAFLKKISERARPKRDKRLPEAPAPRVWRPVRWLVGAAAMFLVATGAVAYLLFAGGESRASSSDVVEKLVDWNLELSNADANERKRLLEENEEKLRDDLKKAELTEEERRLAEELLDSGHKLGVSEDPVKDAETITNISHKLLDRAGAAEVGKKKDSDKCANTYAKFMEHAVKPFFSNKLAQFKGPPPAHVEAKKGPDPGHQQRQFEKYWERSPERSRPDLHKKFDNFFKKNFGGPKGGKR